MADPNDSLSPVDSRYAAKVVQLQPIFSESGLAQRRVQVEVEYLLALSAELHITDLKSTQKQTLRQLYQNFTAKSLQAIKHHEAITHHDVKAVEYYLRDCLEAQQLAVFKPWIHFALTSEDVNNIAQTLQLRDGTAVLLDHSEQLIQQLVLLIDQTKAMPMLARTHGQPAIPTTLGKELLVHLSLLQRLSKQLQSYPYHAKLTGAVGTLAAHHVAFPKLDWLAFSNDFVRSFGFEPVQATTQILPGLYWTQLFSLLQQLCLELAALAQDIWWYISYGYLQQKAIATETGSSTMPQKLNPIDFENAEGNAQHAAAQFAFFITKFSASRLQRDLSDSTVRRNFGVAYGHTLIAIQSLRTGLLKVLPHPESMSQDIQKYPEIISEAYQTLLRAAGITDGYEIIKAATRGGKFNKQSLLHALQQLDIPEQTLRQIKALQTENYIGLAEKIVELHLAQQFGTN